MSSEINLPIYNITNGSVESTKKNSTAKNFALETYKQLENTNLIKKPGAFLTTEDHQEYKQKILDTITSCIKDHDQDGFLDMNIKDFRSKLVSELNEIGSTSKGFLSSTLKKLKINYGIKLKSGHNFYGENFPDDYKKGIDFLEKSISSSPTIDTFFIDDQKNTSKPASDTPIKDIDKLFQKFKEKTWNKSQITKFTKEMNNFLNRNFAFPPVNENDPFDTVNDYSYKKIDDETLKKFSKDKAGKFRVDCEVFARINAQIFKTAGLSTQYGNMVLSVKGKITAHAIAAGITPNGKTVFLTSNNEIINVEKPKEINNNTLKEITLQKLPIPGTTTLKVSFGETPEVATQKAVKQIESIVFSNAFTTLKELNSLANTISRIDKNKLDEKLKNSELSQIISTVRFIRSCPTQLSSISDSTLSNFNDLRMVLNQDQTLSIGENYTITDSEAFIKHLCLALEGVKESNASKIKESIKYFQQAEKNQKKPIFSKFTKQLLKAQTHLDSILSSKLLAGY